MRTLKDIVESVTKGRELGHGESCIYDLDNLTDEELNVVLNTKYLNFDIEYLRGKNVIKITKNIKKTASDLL